ncbi:helix-turn-helix domain-containing protein [Rossellomorea vietnamensis]|uniref:Helix-turn-helix domain-containing protein n=1 Tax=Rossellomorea vietnamensis TaxID=218284 RepID=A0A5D4MDK9_9BACI|nr:helix-turn-helix domain-containing protein [Rossellomorea vietnamensis]TYR99105.1 helix-turn-helix domain-containing protein [Rossellomorea vietnamensis]
MKRRTLTVKEVSEYLGVHSDTIYTMVREKQIPHFKVRRRILFTTESIDAWIRESESQITREAM